MADWAASGQRRTGGQGSRCIGRTPLGHLNDAGVALTRRPRAVKSARPRFVETVGAGASVRVLRLMSQVACRPLGAQCSMPTFCPARGQRQCALMPMDLTGDCGQIGVLFAQRQAPLVVPLAGTAPGSVGPLP